VLDETGGVTIDDETIGEAIGRKLVDVTVCVGSSVLLV